MDEMFELSNTCQVATYIIHDQSHYIKVAQGDIFMEQKMRFGLVLCRMAILKKKLGADYEQLFRGKKNNLIFLK